MTRPTHCGADMVPLRVLSLGGGVQSTTLLLMAEMGQLEPLHSAIFADTQWEPPWVYEHLEWLKSVCRTPIYRVTAGSLRSGERTQNGNGYGASIPFHIRNADGSHGIARRQCTRDYKLDPIRREVRRQVAETGEKQVVQVIGISADEAQRMKDSQVRYIRNEYPLVDLRMTRWDCRLWLSRHGYPQPQRSACIGCPFRSNLEWREIRENATAWADAVDFDRRLRGGSAVRMKHGLVGNAYLHRSLKPLDEVNLSTAEENGQADLFGNECEGMCGN